MQPQIYIQQEGIASGPYTLAQVADLLREGRISGQTPTRLAGEQVSMPLSWQPQFSSIRDLSDSPLASSVDQLIEESVDRSKAPVPMPSGGVVLRALGALVTGVGATSLGALVTWWFDPVTGKFIAYGFLAVSIVVQLVLALMFPDTTFRGYGRKDYGLIEMIIEKKNYPQALFGLAGVCFFLGACAGMSQHAH